MIAHDMLSLVMEVEKLKKHTISFQHAFEGLVWAFKTQPNFKVHLAATLGVIGAGFFFDITRGEWLILVLTIFLVLAAELANTAVEVATDLLVEKKWSRLAKIAKDVSSAAVLTAALGAVLIGLLLFGPRLLPLLSQ